MTWEKLKNLIEEMSSEEQKMSVMIWSEYDCPRPIRHLHKIEENIYTVDDRNSYCDEKYAKAHPEKDIELVLEKGEYCLKS